MTVVGIAGLPGSGKSWLVRNYKDRGFEVFDDVGKGNREQSIDSSSDRIEKGRRDYGY
jgi:dephospho-CoA kinase